MTSKKPPVRIVSPGRCYRRDTPDATHGVHFHQIEGLYIDKEVSLADLKSVLMTFAREFFGSNVSVRMRPHFFPFTEPSVECDFSCVMCGGRDAGYANSPVGLKLPEPEWSTRMSSETSDTTPKHARDSHSEWASSAWRCSSTGSTISGFFPTTICVSSNSSNFFQGFKYYESIIEMAQ
jgi:hypothetical protein